jgi:hypothetical protein
MPALGGPVDGVGESRQRPLPPVVQHEPVDHLRQRGLGCLDVLCGFESAGDRLAHAVQSGGELLHRGVVVVACLQPGQVRAGLGERGGAGGRLLGVLGFEPRPVLVIEPTRLPVGPQSVVLLGQPHHLPLGSGDHGAGGLDVLVVGVHQPA